MPINFMSKQANPNLPTSIPRLEDNANKVAPVSPAVQGGIGPTVKPTLPQADDRLSGFQYVKKVQPQTQPQTQQARPQTTLPTYDPNKGKITLTGGMPQERAPQQNSDLASVAQAYAQRDGLSRPQADLQLPYTQGVDAERTGELSDLAALAQGMSRGSQTSAVTASLPNVDINGDGTVTESEKETWEKITGKSYTDPTQFGDLIGGGMDVITGDNGGDNGSASKDPLSIYRDLDRFKNLDASREGMDNGSLGTLDKADWKQLMSYDYPTPAPTVESTNFYGDPLAAENASALSQSLADTSSDVWEKALQAGQLDIAKRLGIGKGSLSDELSARGLGASGKFAQGIGELEQGAMSEASKLAVEIKKQEIDTALQRLQQTMAFQGNLMTDATKRDLANQASQLEQQKLALQQDEQNFNQQQAAAEQVQAMAYNLKTLGYTDWQSQAVIKGVLGELNKQGVPPTAENIMSMLMAYLGGSMDFTNSPAV